MCRASGLLILGSLLAAGLATGCKQHHAVGANTSDHYFATPFQDESQFIVEAIVSDLAEQVSYAAAHRLPDSKAFSVTATEKPGSPPDAPVYDVRVRLSPDQREVKAELSTRGGIWSPEVYGPLTKELARAVGLKPPRAVKPDDSALVSKLLDNTAETIEAQNQAVSAALEKDFANPDLHEQAALVLGAFMLRENSGDFYEMRSPLCRLTAHLAMARFLRSGAGYDVNGRMAEAVLLTLIGAETPALERLKAIGTNAAPIAAMARALQAFNTLDYRPLDEATNRTSLETMAWFTARAYCTSTSAAWEKLSDEQKQNIDIGRIAHAFGYSVEIGHVLLETSLPLELQEINSVYSRSHDKELEMGQVATNLNALPERCFTQEGTTVRVRVIGWGQWADFFQRHLCHAIQQNFHFMDHVWGVPDEAKRFATQCDTNFGALRLYPFVRRFNCTDVETYHQSVDDAFKVTVATPHLVPSRCWNELCYKPRFAPLYSPNPNPHINEWHRHNPPPGTVYDLGPRLIQPSLIARPDVVAFMESLQKLAPHAWDIATQLETRKYRGHPTYEQAMALYGPFLPYSVGALSQVALTVTNDFGRYEKLMLQAAALNPQMYYTLADYMIDQKKDDKGAAYLEKACQTDPDAVRVSNHSRWRVWYYLKKGQTEKAREIADQAAEVYSCDGLEAKGNFLEATTNYDEAFEWFAKIEERYNRSSPVLYFCLRQMGRTNDQRYAEEVKKRLKILFPKGMEKVALNDFQGAPTDGVLIMQENEPLKAAGLKKGDVIVAVYGTRVHHMGQYIYARELQHTPELSLIVWQGDAYREFKPSPPQHRFGVEFGDYVVKRPGTGT
ncbi:MAG TPA: hypothetical protein VMU04_20180 [Candidatus Acidoferrum sp.]|nr:hypothetical protein [Candidatus Acidoferrum sp.]